jgi:hypothetical protein
VTVVSQNGYSANDRSVIASYTVPGTTRKLALRKGDVSVVLLDFAAWFDANIERIDTGPLDDWAYAERNIRGSSTTLSNHASGTAMDLNATAHQLGRYNTFNKAQIALIERKLKEYKGVIRWGHDYSGRKDEMHFEINAGAAAVRVQADRIRAKNAHPSTLPKTPVKTPVKKVTPAKAAPKVPTVPPFPGNLNSNTVRNNGYLLKWQKQMKARGWTGMGTPDGDGGPKTALVCREFKKEKAITPVNDIIDRATWNAAWTAKK